LITFVLRIGCTIDGTFIGILRHDERLMKVANNREKEDEDSRKDLESKRETKQDFEEMKQVLR
jgi:hypothetical protein